MKFGIISGKDNKRSFSPNKKAQELAKKVRDYLGGKKQEITEDVTRSDLVIVLGGDGTLIRTASTVDVPLLGINVGNFGFLTACEAEDWQRAIDLVIAKTYVVSQRMTIEARLGKDIYSAVNEIVVKGMYRVIKLEILVNGQNLMSTSGDGVIVATQTGSTAYSLSAGGPIVDPELDCFVITPVNAHGLQVPSVVLSPNDQIEIKLISGDDVSLIVDGHEHIKLSQSQSVKVKSGEHKVRLVYFDKEHFLKALNSKFGLARTFK